MIYISLFIEFIKIGLFSIGGGLASLPFLFNLIDKYTWYTTEELINMIAISESTPGPIGVNIATYVGMTQGGLLGSVLASISIALPSMIISLILAKQLMKFKKLKIVQDIFYYIRPVVAGLIGAAAFTVLKASVFQFEIFKETKNILSIVNPIALILFIIIFIATKKIKAHPVIFLAISAVFGIIIQL